MVKVLISWLVSAIILWLIAFLANRFSIPFVYVTLVGWWAVILVAIVLGLLNAFVGPFVKSLFKAKNAAVVLIISLVIDAGVLMLMSWILSNHFSLGGRLAGFISALIIAAIMAIVNSIISGAIKDK